MKLSHLTLAILAGISLAACGGSGNDDHVNPDQGKDQGKDQETKPETKPEETPAEDKEIIDPTDSKVVSYFKLDEKPSQGTTQYLRNKSSNFDRQLNPKEPSSATAILGVDLNSQNPWFTNFVAAQTKFTKGDESVTVAQFLGVNKTGTDGLDDPKSLQSENRKNVVRPGDIFDSKTNSKTINDPIEAKIFSTHLDTKSTALKEAIDNKLTELEKDSEKNKEEIAALKKTKESVDEFSNKAKKAIDNHSGSGFIILTRDNKAIGTSTNPNPFRWGDKIPNARGDHGELADVGLVGINFQKQDTKGQLVNDSKGNPVIEHIQGTEEESLSTTRLFGRYFLADDTPDAEKSRHNSYLQATTVAYDVGLPDGSGEIKSKPLDSAIKDAHVEYALAVEPMELHKVQYGRITGNLDPSGKEITNKMYKTGGIVREESFFRGRQDEDAVNYYVYRGTDATTLEQMKALPSDQVLRYQGHALMYGIDNNFHGNGDNLPNSFGDSSSRALGNFVKAELDVAKAEVKGKVYNAWQFDNTKAGLIEDSLVTFKGKVHGNTAIGSAELTYKTAPAADFRASFFGEKAQEMGGSFNATTFKQKYGPTKWGGVFGAQQIGAPQTQSNAWLGDVNDEVVRD